MKESRNRFRIPKRVPIGDLVVTEAADRYVTQEDVLAAITRHGRGDWGDVDDETWTSNDFAIFWKGRLRSEFSTANGERFLVMADLTRSITRVASPDDYE